MKNNNLIIGGAIGLVAVAIIAWFFLGGSGVSTGGQEVSMENPINTTLNFYDPWFIAVQSGDADPYQLGLADNPILGEDLKVKLAEAKGSTPDPVICQTTMPEQISARPVYENEDGAQVVVYSREEGQTEQAIVTLTRLNEGWYISDIECSAGEFAPEREFSFDIEGFLLKSVPPPLEAGRWHIIFEQNGEPGHFAPLFFDGQSMCVSTDGRESVCAPEQFTEASKAHVQGEMTELGVEVKRIQMVRE